MAAFGFHRRFGERPELAQSGRGAIDGGIDNPLVIGIA
jgi:hypothetical protein